MTETASLFLKTFSP